MSFLPPASPFCPPELGSSFGLTRVSHGAEDALGDRHDGVRGLVVAPDRLSPRGVLADVLQEIPQGLTHHAGCRAHLQRMRCTSSTLVLRFFKPH